MPDGHAVRLRKESRDHVLHSGRVDVHAGAISSFDGGRKVSAVTELCFPLRSRESPLGHRTLPTRQPEPMEERSKCNLRQIRDQEVGIDK